MEKSIKIMTIIGIVVQGLATVFSLLLMVLAASGVMTTDVSTTVNGEVDPVDAETAAIFTVLFLSLFIFGIISIILGAIGMFKASKNKKMSGILLIIGAVISGNIITFALWLISGIKLLTNNKPKDEISDLS
ncbi:TPA: DUF4064 domain-containing protein [Staphylococcus aureus]|uniref:DUF4064 domain-containing protein n=1 Tax=Staphylococcus aureus TaxID=1280 RepID=UPI00091249E8|nr:DUF4064 domain-containing protein [Staphylococcus aureus]EKF1724071.1 DUF4064 domain-containing protein [Staphylococcus aureus]MBU6103066.1 DUF4064 domain-containing protein [Staphylococcus aureus]MCC1366981.1 DUF4064 domain-containing protein [Staphylococcus aureus]MDI1517166.1 DUF4064 domain-containing protein [Staphylococcus aureus]MDI1552256.1 DUF4064 domain-containing protein [Staphylococcus aureus]